MGTAEQRLDRSRHAAYLINTGFRAIFSENFSSIRSVLVSPLEHNRNNKKNKKMKQTSHMNRKTPPGIQKRAVFTKRLRMYATGSSATPNLSNYHTHIWRLVISRLNTGKIEQILRSDGPGKQRNSTLDTYCHDDRPTGATNHWIIFNLINFNIIFSFCPFGRMVP